MPVTPRKRSRVLILNSPRTIQALEKNGVVLCKRVGANNYLNIKVQTAQTNKYLRMREIKIAVLRTQN